MLKNFEKEERKHFQLSSVIKQQFHIPSSERDGGQRKFFIDQRNHISIIRSFMSKSNRLNCLLCISFNTAYVKSEWKYFHIKRCLRYWRSTFVHQFEKMKSELYQNSQINSLRRRCGLRDPQFMSIRQLASLICRKIENHINCASLTSCQIRFFSDTVVFFVTGKTQIVHTPPCGFFLSVARLGRSDVIGLISSSLSK